MAWAASFLAHAVFAAGGAVLATAPDRPPLGQRAIELRVQRRDELSIELPALALETLRGAWSDTSAPPNEAMPGGEAVSRPDTGRDGRGGERSADEAINLAARDDEATLSPLLQSRIDRSQHARRKNARERRSPEDDSVSDHPTVLTLFVDGGELGHAPWQVATTAPLAGTLLGRLRHHPGGLVDPLDPGAGVPPRPWAAGDGLPYEDEQGFAAARLPSDSAGGVGAARERPMSLPGEDSSSADERGELSDTQNAEQEDQTEEPGLLHASTAGGSDGAGKGGEAAPGPTGSGGEVGKGSRSSALGSGSGNGGMVDPADARRRRYLRNVWARIQGSWSANDFPRDAAIEGKQGYTIVSFVIHKDGSVSAVRTARGSGFPSFDAKMRAAVRRAAPFGPLPKDFGGAVSRTHTFIVSNPAVR
jgi:TonB family protein